ncbi:MAG: FIST C-terminal domain-containing protein [Deltaproteobacteria bacterium]|nr:FIST C-terminal domain-containing protein [Deltaproteobacteria bacterium]
MICAGIGLGRGFPTGAAASQAATAAMRGCGGPAADLVVVFATSEHFDDEHALVGPLVAATRARALVGCSASGVIAGTEEVEHESAIAVLAVSGIRASSFIEADAATRAPEIGAALRAAADGADALLVLPDALSFKPHALLSPLAGATATVVGAASSGVGPGPMTWQIGGGRVVGRAVAAARIEGVRVSVGVTHAARPIGPSFRITSGERNLLRRLGDQTAVDAFRSALPPALGQDVLRAASGMMVAVGECVGRSGHVMRAIVGIDVASGAIALGSPVPDGSLVRFAVRDPEGARQDLSAMLKELAGELGGARAAFGLYFDCTGRGEGLHGLPGIDTAYIQGALGDFPLLGLFGGAEIGPTARGPDVHQLSGILTLFR